MSAAWAGITWTVLGLDVWGRVSPLTELRVWGPDLLLGHWPQSAGSGNSISGPKSGIWSRDSHAHSRLLTINVCHSWETSQTRTSVMEVQIAL